MAFLKERSQKGHISDNCTVLTGASVSRIVFSPEGQAKAVEFSHQGESQTAKASKEIVLSAGALETPKILMLSGVGPADHLRSLDIPVVLDQPRIGEGLHDHPNVPVFLKAKREIDCHYPQLYSFFRSNPDTDLPPGQSDTCYVYWPAPSSMKHMMQRMLPPQAIPHAFYGPRSRQFVRGMVGAAFRVGAVQRFTDRLFGIIVILGKPKSRGSLRLKSAKADDQALIDPAYYEDPEDLETMVRGVRLARSIGQAKGLANWDCAELMPGRRVQSDAAIARYVRKNTITTYHFAGTCGMGTSESHAVDAKLRLRGVRGLRIADASVIPWTPVSALNAPSMLIGYRAAQLLLRA